MQNTVVKKYCMNIRLHSKQCKIIKKHKLQVPKNTAGNIIQNVTKYLKKYFNGRWCFVMDRRCCHLSQQVVLRVFKKHGDFRLNCIFSS